MLYLEVIPGATTREVELKVREGKVGGASLCCELWEPGRTCISESFPPEQGRCVFIHQLLPVTGLGLPAQGPPALPGRYLTWCGSWEQLLKWIHQAPVSDRPLASRDAAKHLCAQDLV